MPASPEELLDPFRAAPQRAGVLTDFDGTLAAIVEDPGLSRPLPDAVDVLHRLAGVYRRVAVVSGRPASFLATHLELAERGGAGDGLLAVGLYGLETADGGQVTTDPRAAGWRAVIDEVAARADVDAPADVLVERKGLALTLHYRSAPHRAGWVEGYCAEQAARTGLVLHPAKMSAELRPPLAVDKGTVVDQLAAGLGAVCFLGDDVGDLPAFEVLDRLATTGVSTVKVGVRSAEAPPEMLDAADIVVDGPAGALAVLSALLASPSQRWA